jgi:hypothetical protein
MREIKTQEEGKMGRWTRAIDGKGKKGKYRKSRTEKKERREDEEEP